MKHTNLSSVIALIALFIVSTATAQNARLKSPLSVTDNGLTFTICYDISGLGNVSQVTMELNFDATVSGECRNPGNGDVVPAHNKVVSDVGEEFAVPVHNGRAVGCFTTTSTFTPGRCPNTNWTSQVTNVSFSGITLSVLGKTFTANNP
ncbi:MAG TPA: hypothetical protein VF008_26695 [Niastella sp.]